MTTTHGREAPVRAAFADRSGALHEHPTPWRPVKVPAAEIEAEIDRLAALPRPVDGRRAAAIVHPEATGPGRGLAPGIDVTVEVLLPGESTTPVRRNSSQVVLGIQGSGQVRSGTRAIALDRWDVCNLPSMEVFSYRNTGERPWVRLVYSNAPLLATLGVAYAETILDSLVVPAGPVTDSSYNRGTAPDFPVSDLGSRVRGYEWLVDIEVVENLAQHWPWQEVSRHLSSELGDGRRTILAYYNPATERRNGATHSFFVTATKIPPGAPEIPEDAPGHRHNSVAINYHAEGTGFSVVDGETIHWGPGDLLLSAPGWREHMHSPGPAGITVFTVQDHPLHIGMESLIWQEDMGGPILTLGSDPGLTGYVGPREAGR
ncbi:MULTISPECIES: AraC family ligand binding domain-containing protein [unclassified Blastococcus]